MCCIVSNNDACFFMCSFSVCQVRKLSRLALPLAFAAQVVDKKWYITSEMKAYTPSTSSRRHAMFQQQEAHITTWLCLWIVMSVWWLLNWTSQDNVNVRIPTSILGRTFAPNTLLQLHVCPVLICARPWWISILTTHGGFCLGVCQTRLSSVIGNNLLL